MRRPSFELALLSALLLAWPSSTFAGPPEAEPAPEPEPSSLPNVDEQPSEAPSTSEPGIDASTPDTTATPSEPREKGKVGAWASRRPNEQPLADSGDARPTAPPNPQPLLEAKGKIGPKQTPASVAVYGMIVTNLVYDSGSVIPSGESPVIASLGSRVGEGLPTDGEFLITARQSRFGFRAGVQLTDKLDIQGNIELDFFGLHENTGPTSVVQPAVRLRLAKLEFGSQRFRFIAGQDWSVVTPRLPTSLSHMVVAAHSFGGAVWARFPQLTFLMRLPIAGGQKLGDPRFQLQVSVVRHFSGDGFGGGITRFDLPDPGTLSRLPLGQARVAFESDMLSIGAGAHIGRESHPVVRLDGNGELETIDDHVPTWMVTGDLQIKSKWVWFAGQGYYGVNINGMLSNQGVRHDRWTEDLVDPMDPRFGQDRDVVAMRGGGGWAEFGALLGTKQVQWFISAGVDVGERDRVAVGTRWLNNGVLTGLIYAPFEVFDMSIEYQRVHSFYRGPTNDAPREQRLGINDFLGLSFRFKF